MRIQKINDNSAKTAIHRKGPSLPLRVFLNMEDISFKNKKILDYGCGYGADVKHLRELGIDAYGYDKYIKSEFNTVHKDSEGKFNIVLCTYVINTIPDFNEKIKIIKDAYHKLKNDGIIIITTRHRDEVRKQAAKSGWKPSLFGFITKRGTYQRGFSAGCLGNLIQWLRDERGDPVLGIRTIANNKFTTILATKGSNDTIKYTD